MDDHNGIDLNHVYNTNRHGSKERLSNMRFIPFSIVLSVAFFHPVAASAQSQLKSLGYVLQADKLAKSKAAAIRLLTESDRDLIVIDASYDGTSRWTKSEIDTIRSGKSERNVVCYLSIGEAEDYRSYWKDEWDADKDGSPDANAPKFLNAENPDWEGNYKVKYWHQQWQEIILSELQQIVAQGFDGVYLDIVDGYEFFEYDAESDDWIDDRPNAETGNTFREDMVEWVSKIRNALSVDGRRGLLIPQNGEALVESNGYLDLIDAIGAEDIFTTGRRPQKKSEVKYRTKFLKKASEAGKPVFVIEYPKNERVTTSAIDGAKAAGFSLLLTDRSLKTLGKSNNP